MVACPLLFTQTSPLYLLTMAPVGMPTVGVPTPYGVPYGYVAPVMVTQAPVAFAHFPPPTHGGYAPGSQGVHLRRVRSVDIFE